MDQKIKVLLIDRDDSSRASLYNLLASDPLLTLRSESSWGEALLESLPAYAPQIVIANLYPDENAGLRLVERIMKLTADQPPVMIITGPTLRPEVLRSAIRLGIRDFFGQPYNRDEVLNVVHAAVKYLSERERIETGKGQIWSFFGAKGGVGCTTLAVNLGVACARRTSEKVLLVDLNLQSGHDALYLNVKSKYTVFDVLQNLENLDLDVLLKTMPRHASGLYVLPGLFHIEEAELVTGAQIGTLLDILCSSFDLILVDNHPFFNEVSLKALDLSEKIFLISTLDLPTIYNSKRVLDLFTKMGYLQDKILVVLNRYEFYPGLQPQEMEKVLRFPIFGRVNEHDIGVVTACANHGVPIVLKVPHSKMSRDILDIADRLMGTESEFEESKKPSFGLFKNVFKR